MSTNREDFGVIYEVEAGSRKTIEHILEDANGNVIDMTDTSIYNTGQVKVYKPDGTMILTSPANISFDDRPNGKISWTITKTDNINTNAGNWIGNLEISNNIPVVIDQRKFNFNIIESY